MIEASIPPSKDTQMVILELPKGGLYRWFSSSHVDETSQIG